MYPTKLSNTILGTSSMKTWLGCCCWAIYASTSFPWFCQMIDWLLFNSKSNRVGDPIQYMECFYSIYILPPSWNVDHFKIFSIDYGDGEKTLLLLIIKNWDTIWVIKYVLIKVLCFFSCNFPTYTSPYIVTCTSFYWKRLENNAQLRWFYPLST